MDLNLSRIPNAGEMFTRFRSETWSLAVLIVVLVLSIFTVCLYIEVLVFFHRCFKFGWRRGLVIYICGVFPVHSVTSLFGLSIPTASFICTYFADMYIAIALYALLLLMTDFFGGLDSTVRALSDISIPLRQPPICCCICLPSVKLSKKKFHLIRTGVLQYIIVLLFVVLVPALLWVDQLIHPTQSGLYSRIETPATVINVVSTLTAIYSLMLLFRASRTPLRRFQLRGQVVSVQAVLVLVNFQRVIITILIRTGVIGCIRPLHCAPDLVLKTILNLLILFEMPLVMLINRLVIQRWIRTGTYTECFQLDVKPDAEGANHSDLPPPENNHKEGEYENKTISHTDPDLSTLV